MNAILSITKSLFTDFYNIVEAYILLIKKNHGNIHLLCIYRRDPDTRWWFHYHYAAYFKNTFCSYSEGRKWYGVAEVGLLGQKEKKKKLPGECAEARGQVTQTIKTPHAFCTSPCQWGLFPLFCLEIYGAVTECRKPLTAVCCHSDLKDSMLW